MKEGRLNIFNKIFSKYKNCLINLLILVYHSRIIPLHTHIHCGVGPNNFQKQRNFILYFIHFFVYSFYRQEKFYWEYNLLCWSFVYFCLLSPLLASFSCFILIFENLYYFQRNSEIKSSFDSLFFSVFQELLIF